MVGAGVLESTGEELGHCVVQEPVLLLRLHCGGPLFPHLKDHVEEAEIGWDCLGQQQLPHVIHSTQDTGSPATSADKQESEQAPSWRAHKFLPSSPSQRSCCVAQAGPDLLIL